MVLPVEFYRLENQQVAAESAFVEHLRMLRDSLGEDISELSIAAPQMSQEAYEQRRPYLECFDELTENLFYIPLEQKGGGRLRYLLQHLPANAARIWRAVGRSDIVHAGPSHIFELREFLATFLAVLRGKKTVFVVDIDWRAAARMNLATGRLSRKSYLLATWLYDPWKSAQVRFAARRCSLVLLKGSSMVVDYGDGRPNVMNVLDAAHSAEYLADTDRLAADAAVTSVRIPRHPGHRFHGIAVTDSIASRSPIPRDRGH